MSVLVLYASQEGQTAKIAKFAAEQVQKSGHAAKLVNVDHMDNAISFKDASKIILAAPVHERRHPRSFEALVNAFSDEINARSTMMLSVSLKAAFPEGYAEAQDYLVEMKMRTRLKPETEMLVPGAVRRKAYDYYQSQVLRHVVLEGQSEAFSGEDVEFTDWSVLQAKIGDFLKTPMTAS